MVTSSELLTQPLERLVAAGCDALAKASTGEDDQDEAFEQLEQVDEALLHYFLDTGHGSQQTALIAAILAILESREARKFGRPGVVERWLARWEQTVRLLRFMRESPESRKEAAAELDLDKDGVSVAEAARETAKLGDGRRVLEMVARAGTTGLTISEIARQLGASGKPKDAGYVSRLVARLAHKGIVERHPSGKNCFVILGPVGRALVARPAMQVKVTFHNMTAALEAPKESFAQV